MTSSSKELEDYWNEFNTIEQANIHNYEEEPPKAADEVEVDAAWLDAAGFQSLVTKFQDGKDLSEDELDSLTDTLTQTQAETVRKRVNALSTTLRRKNKMGKPHVRDIFPSSEEILQANYERQNNECLLPAPTTTSNEDNDAQDRDVYGDSERQTIQSCNESNLTSSETMAVAITLEFHLEERKKSLSADSLSSDLENSDLPIFELRYEPLGVTFIGDLSDADMQKIKALAHIELTALFDSQNINYSRPRRKRKSKENGIFGVPLVQLVEQDQKRSPGTTVPIVFQAMINFLEKDGLTSEGIMRVSRAETRTKQLRQDLEDKFYQGLFSWGEAGPHDVAVVFKQFLRELPVPLLSYDYLDAFHQISNMPRTVEQLKALNLLILLLTKEHRNTLKVLLKFLRNVSRHSDQNKMSLNNVAMIMAPNLFLAPPKCNKDKIDLDVELKRAAGTSNIVKMLIHYQDVLWIIPSAFVMQLRNLNTSEARRKNRMGKLLWKKNKDKATDFYKVQQLSSFEQPDITDPVIKVQAPGTNLSPVQIHLDHKTTAADVVQKVKGHRRGEKESCSEEMFARSHLHALNDPSESTICDYLFEVGGNLGERCLDPAAQVLDLLYVNPSAEWVIKSRVGRPALSGTLQQ